MPRELSARGREIVAAAREILEEAGPEALTMRHIAERLGIRAPSLYKHLPDKQALEAAIVSSGLEEQAEVIERAMREATGDPLDALAMAYRAFAHGHPHLYRLMTEGPLARGRLLPGVEARAALPIYRAAGEDADLARAASAFAHGMTILELDGRFPPEADLDAAWHAGIAAIRGAVRP